jgi:hypothetical protein
MRAGTPDASSRHPACLGTRNAKGGTAGASRHRWRQSTGGGSPMPINPPREAAPALASEKAHNR